MWRRRKRRRMTGEGDMGVERGTLVVAKEVGTALDCMTWDA